MKAWVLHAPGELEYTTVDDPRPTDDEIVLETEAVSVCSTDVSVFRGHIDPPSWPVIPGHEYVGRVAHVGPAHRTRFTEGDRLVLWGQSDFNGLARYRAARPLPTVDGEETWHTTRGFIDADHAALTVVPDLLPSHAATFAEPLTGVMRALLANPPFPGDRVLMLGAGPISALGIQVMTRMMAVGSVTVLDRDSSRLRMASAAGAEMTYNPVEDVDELEDWARRTDEAAVDYVFDALPNLAPSSTDPRALALRLVKPGGTYVLYGATTVPQGLTTWQILAKAVTLRAAGFDQRVFALSRSQHVLDAAVRAIKTGLIDHRLVMGDRVRVDDEPAVRRSFADYGADGLKPSVYWPELHSSHDQR
jgi:threonine dehydrogenase-like Zn-dependent dehydrogenase